MTTYNILIIEPPCSDQKLVGKFSVADCEKFLDRLEETLYILFELEPMFREWKHDFLLHNSTYFTYHMTETYAVEKHGHEVIIYQK